MLAWLRKKEQNLKFPTKTGVNTPAYQIRTKLDKQLNRNLAKGRPQNEVNVI